MFSPHVSSDLSSPAADSGVSECLALTSDSETEIFCDSVDSVEQLSSIRVRRGPGSGVQCQKFVCHMISRISFHILLFTFSVFFRFLR